MAFDLANELEALVRALDQEGIDYALCGGLAMAVYGAPRATIDIDLLVAAADAEGALRVARQAGFTLPANEMVFAGGDIRMHRVSKIDPDTGDPVSLDLIQVTPRIEAVWRHRQEVEWQAGVLWVVSRAGLIELKKIRSSTQDRADIERLEEDPRG